MASQARFDADADFKKRAYLEVVSLQNGQDADVTKAWNLICDVSRREFNRIYTRLDIRLEEKGESFYQKMMDGVVANLTATGLVWFPPLPATSSPFGALCCIPLHYDPLFESPPWQLAASQCAWCIAVVAAAAAAAAACFDID